MPDEATFDLHHLDEVVLRYQATEDNDLLSDIITAFEPVVFSVSKKYFLPWGDRDDLLQEGRMGLIKAIQNFRPDKNMAFFTYAVYSIRYNLLTALRTYGRNKHRVLTKAKSVDAQIYDDDPLEWIDRFCCDAAAVDERILMQEDFTACDVLFHKKFSRYEASVLYGWLQGEQYSDIAKRLGKSIKSVDNALQRAKKHILDLDRSDPGFFDAFKHYLSFHCSGEPFYRSPKGLAIERKAWLSNKPPRPDYRLRGL